MQSPTRQEMYRYYFKDPKRIVVTREMENVLMRYYYFAEPLVISTGENEVLNFCLLKGTSKLSHNDQEFTLNQFDLVFLPENDRITIEPSISERLENKICIVTSPILGDTGKKMNAKFEIQRFSLEKFIPRGELGDSQKMATYREVWTAFKNGYYMSGFTNIPQKALAQGVVTSVNLEKEGEQLKVFSHVHPEYPEIYIYCIDNTTESVAVTQFLINSKGQSVSRDLTDGEGLFFHGSLGHINFTKPTYIKLKFCLYLWIIPTFGKSIDIVPVTLKT